MKRPRLFPGIVFGLIGLNVSIVTLTVYLAHSDASFAVEPDYYQKAVDWDQSARRAATSADLGWTFVLEAPIPEPGHPRAITLRLSDRNGAPVADAAVKITAFASARASDRRLIAMQQIDPGLYAGTLGPAAGGLWEFHITASHAADHFEASLERSIAAGGAP